MTIRRFLALALAAGIAGVLIGRTTVSHEAPRTEVEAPRLPSTALRAGRACKVSRVELAATKAQLADCMAGANEPPEPGALTAVEEAERAEAERVRRNMEVRRTHKEVVLVKRADLTLSIYPANEPIPDGIIVARTLPSGELGWYAGPDAGPRSDPAAFRPEPPAPTWGRLPDGTITLDGKPAAPAVQKMFGGKYEKDQEE